MFVRKVSCWLSLSSMFMLGKTWWEGMCLIRLLWMIYEARGLILGRKYWTTSSRGLLSGSECMEFYSLWHKTPVKICILDTTKQTQNIANQWNLTVLSKFALPSRSFHCSPIFVTKQGWSILQFHQENSYGNGSIPEWNFIEIRPFLMKQLLGLSRHVNVLLIGSFD